MLQLHLLLGVVFSVLNVTQGVGFFFQCNTSHRGVGGGVIFLVTGFFSIKSEINEGPKVSVTKCYTTCDL